MGVAPITGPRHKRYPACRSTTPAKLNPWLIVNAKHLIDAHMCRYFCSLSAASPETTSGETCSPLAATDGVACEVHHRPTTTNTPEEPEPGAKRGPESVTVKDLDPHG